MLFIFKNFCVSYDTKEVLSDITFSIKKNEIISIIGPSGCGKTTLLNSISGLLKKTSGTRKNNSSRISYVFQEDRLIPWKTVFENILIVNKKAGHRRLMKLLEEVGLDGTQDHYPTELSGGMRQRVAIARAFIYPADLLLMDEPLKSLDYILRLQMIDHIRALWAETQRAIVYVTHEIDEAILLSDTILILDGSPATIKHRLLIDTDKKTRMLTDPVLVAKRNEIIHILRGS